MACASACSIVFDKSIVMFWVWVRGGLCGAGVVPPGGCRPLGRAGWEGGEEGLLLTADVPGSPTSCSLNPQVVWGSQTAPTHATWLFVLQDTTTIPSVRTTRRSSKRQRVAQASSEDSALTSSILVPHNGDKAAVDATTRQHDMEAAEKAVVTALVRSTCPQEGGLPVVSAGRPRRLSARRTKYELREEEDTRIASAEEQRSRQACATRTAVSGVNHAQVVAAAESLVLLKHTVPSKRGSKRGSKPRSKVPQTSSMWSNLDLLATAACDMSGTQRATRRGLRSRS